MYLCIEPPTPACFYKTGGTVFEVDLLEVVRDLCEGSVGSRCAAV